MLSLRPSPAECGPVAGGMGRLAPIFFLLLGVLSGCGWFGGSEELILTRRGDPDSRAIADCYADRRGIAKEHILELSLGAGTAKSTIDALTFEKEIENAIERHLILSEDDGDTTVLVTTRGLPLFVQDCRVKIENRCAVTTLDAALAQLGRTPEDRAFAQVANPFFRDPRTFEEFRQDEPDTALRFLVTRLGAGRVGQDDEDTCPNLLADALDREAPESPDSEDEAPPSPLWQIVSEAPRAQRAQPAAALLDPLAESLPRYGHRVCDGCAGAAEAPAGVVIASAGGKPPARLDYPGVVLSLPAPATGDPRSAKVRTRIAKAFDTLVDRWLARGATSLSLHLDDPILAHAIRPTPLIESWARGETAIVAHWKSVPTLGVATILVGDPHGQLAVTGDLSITLDDRDGDGIANREDNCPNEPNRDQRDTNADGFGNRCDADVDDDGLVDSSRGAIYPLDERGDLEAITLTARNGPYDPNHDLDGDGQVDERDLVIARMALGRPPGR